MRISGIILGYLLGRGSPINALVEIVDKSGTVVANEFVDQSLFDAYETAYYSANELPDQSKAHLNNIEVKFGLKRGSTRADARSGHVANINPSTPIIPGGGVGNRLLLSVGTDGSDNGHGPPDWAQLATQGVKDWMIDNQETIDIDPNEFFQEGYTNTAVQGDDGDTIQLHLERTYQGLNVVGSHISATVKKGNLISLSFGMMGKIKSINTNPNLSYEEAYAKLSAHAGVALAGGETCEPKLEILTLANGKIPEPRGFIRSNNPFEKDTHNGGYKYHLVWTVCPKLEGQKHEMIHGYVNAKNGQVISFKDKNDYFQAVGDVYPTTNDGRGPDGEMQDAW